MDLRKRANNSRRNPRLNNKQNSGRPTLVSQSAENSGGLRQKTSNGPPQESDGKKTVLALNSGAIRIGTELDGLDRHQNPPQLPSRFGKHRSPGASHPAGEAPCAEDPPPRWKTFSVICMQWKKRKIAVSLSEKCQSLDARIGTGEEMKFWYSETFPATPNAQSSPVWGGGIKAWRLTSLPVKNRLPPVRTITVDDGALKIFRLTKSCDKAKNREKSSHFV